MNRLTVKSFNILRNINLAQRRLFSSSCILRGDHHHHHPEPSHSDDHHKQPKKLNFFQKITEPTADDLAGYAYRRPINMDGNLGKFLSEVLMTFLWFWIFYNFMTRPEDFFGHHPYPDTSKWTDAELGIKDE
jgi:hypothetical protein